MSDDRNTTVPGIPFERRRGRLTPRDIHEMCELGPFEAPSLPLPLLAAARFASRRLSFGRSHFSRFAPSPRCGSSADFVFAITYSPKTSSGIPLQFDILYPLGEDASGDTRH